MRKVIWRNKLIALILIMSLLWSDFAFIVQGVLSIAEGELEDFLDVNVQQEITKHAQYDEKIAENQIDTTTIVQVLLKISLNEKTENIDELGEINIQETNISIDIPKYNNSTVQKVEVASTKTEMTNGDEYGDKFENNNWNYNELTGILNITVNNTNKLSLEGEDEYYITYFYKNATYNPNMTIECKADVDITVTNIKEDTSENITIHSSKDEEHSLTQADNSLISSSIFAQTQEINKGKMYSNLDALNAIYPIYYDYTTTLNISCNDKIDNIVIKDKEEIFENKENEDIEAYMLLEKGDTEYTQIQLSKKQFRKVLGDAGKISVYDTAGNILATIDMQGTKYDRGEVPNEESEEGNTEPETENEHYSTEHENDEDSEYYTIDFKKALCYTSNNSIILKTSKPVSDGFLSIYTQKIINSKLELTKEELLEYNNFHIQTSVEFLTEGAEQSIIRNNSLDITLTEIYTNAYIKTYNTITTAENNKVLLKIELDNSRENSDLWVNPLLFIEFPKEIESVEIEEINLLYNENLNIVDVEQIEVNGKLVIKIQMEGIQEDYITESIKNGTTIVLSTIVKTKELVGAKKQNCINLYYLNENVTKYETTAQLNINDVIYELGLSNTNIDFVAPIEMKLIQKISGYSDKENNITTINEEEKVGKIDILDSSKIAQMEISLINNTGNKAKDMCVIGRFPVKGNKEIEEDEDLETTIDSVLNDPITSLMMEEKQIEIYYSENGEATKDLNLPTNGWTNIVNDLSKIKSYLIIIPEIEIGETITFNYNFKIPEELEHGENVYGTCAAYYISELEEGTVQEKQLGGKIGLTTGVGARMNISQEVSVGDGTTVNEGDLLKYTIRVENTGSVTATGVKVKNAIPNAALLKTEVQMQNPISTETQYEYYQYGNDIIWELGDLEIGQIITLEFEVEVDRLPNIIEFYGMDEGFVSRDGKYYITRTNEETGEETEQELTGIPEIYIINKSSLTAENIEKELISNTTRNKVKGTYIAITENSTQDKYAILSEEQEYEYIIKVENKTDSTLNDVKISKLIPEGIEYKGIEISKENISVEYNEEQRKLNIKTNFGPNEYIEIKIKVQVEKLPQETYEKEIKTNTHVEYKRRKNSKFK